jgi:hypothetical protein
MLAGYAHYSADAQDLTAQRDALTAIGVKASRIYVDHGLTGTCSVVQAELRGGRMEDLPRA